MLHRLWHDGSNVAQTYGMMAVMLQRLWHDGSWMLVKHGDIL